MRPFAAFPQYWSLVPKDYEVAYIGKCDVDPTVAVDQLVSRHIPWCTTMSEFLHNHTIIDYL